MAGKLEEMIGRKFGKLTVIECAGTHVNNRGKRRLMFKCKCDCGNEKIVIGYYLRCGDIVSCGCKKSERAKQHMREVSTKHGLSNTRLFNIWHGMKGRCLNPTDKDYRKYGAIGKTICPEWRDDFKAFYDWAMANGYEDNRTIDRIDNDKGYSPDNCRWATHQEQALNRRNNIYLTIDGETKHIDEWLKIAGVPRERVVYRIKKGYSHKDALFTPPDKRKQHRIKQPTIS